jgi:hypothetical protein
LTRAAGLSTTLRNRYCRGGRGPGSDSELAAAMPWQTNNVGQTTTCPELLRAVQPGKQLNALAKDYTQPFPSPRPAVKRCRSADEMTLSHLEAVSWVGWPRHIAVLDAFHFSDSRQVWRSGRRRACKSERRCCWLLLRLLRLPKQARRAGAKGRCCRGWRGAEK